MKKEKESASKPSEKPDPTSTTKITGTSAPFIYRTANGATTDLHAAEFFVTASFGHIYMGTLGIDGLFEGMWTGYVDAVWARQQHGLWYEETMRERHEETEA